MLYEDLRDEWKEWLDLTPIERFRASEKNFAQYLAMGGSFDPEPIRKVLSTIQTSGV